MKRFKKLWAILLVMAMVVTLLPPSAISKVSASTTAGNATGGFYVDGTTLYDANGNPFIMRGINAAHTWYKDYSETSIKAIADAGCNTVRIVLSDGKQWTKDDLASVKNLISLCKQNQLIAVVEVHDATGSNNASDLLAAADYFVEMKEALIGNEAYVIVNIANEWYGDWATDAWKEGYVSAIKVLRDAGIKNTLMVDAAGWGQYPASIANAGKEVLAADTLGNTMFSTHMYEYAGGNETMVKDNIDSIISQDLCLVIGEFGCKHIDGDVDEDTIMSYCEEKNVGYMGWSWKGNSSNVSFLDLTNDWAGTNLTTWGDRLINGTNGIKETSEICSVYIDGVTTTVPATVTPSSQAPVETTASVSPSPSQITVTSFTPVAGTTNLYSGSASVSSWSDALTLNTVKDGGTFDPSMITEDGYFKVTYTGTENGVQLVFQSWSGGEGWACVSPSETTEAEDQTYVATFTYDDIVAAYGTNFSALDVLHVKSTSGAIVLKSFDYVTTDSSAESGVESASPIVSENVSVAPSESAEPEESIAPSESADVVESAEPSETATPSETQGNTVNYYNGSLAVSSWSNAIELSAVKDGGTFDPSVITEDGYFKVTYTGDKDVLQMIFQSWSGGTGWACVAPTETVANADGSYSAIFDYDTITAVYGTSFDKLDKVYVSVQNGSVTITSFDYVTGEEVTPSKEVTPSETVTATPAITEPVEDGTLTARSFAASDEFVKVIGRTYFNDVTDTRWLANTASGIEFTMTGTKASITVKGDSTAADSSSDGNRARIAIYVNDELVIDDMVDTVTETYDVLNVSEAQTATIKLIKLSESAGQAAGIASIDVTSASDIEPTAEKERKIEFIGDSITCGYGIDDENISGGFKTDTENGSKTYAYKTAKNLDADYSIFSVSGSGIISAYTSDSSTKNTSLLVPDFYDDVAFSWSTFEDSISPTSLAWDFADFETDAVVINLGTNDASYCGTDAEKIEEFTVAYVEFLSHVRAKNPNATIFCTLGIMGADLYPAIEDAVSRYTAQTGDTNITSMQFDAQLMSDGICVDWHPSETTNTKAATKLTSYLEEVMGW